MSGSEFHKRRSSPQRRRWHPTPVLLPGKSHGRRSLVGCSPWGRTRQSDFTFTFHFHALEKDMATHSSVLAWRIPGMEEPGRLPSMGSHRVGHDWSNIAAAAAAAAAVLPKEWKVQASVWTPWPKVLALGRGAPLASSFENQQQGSHAEQPVGYWKWRIALQGLVHKLIHFKSQCRGNSLKSPSLHEGHSFH